jgi:parvulin-like peptidyl-prolyl isomerase
MMTKLREFSKIFIIILALSFIGLMVFEWGMDYTGLSSRRDVVGSVNGQELSYEMYSDMFQQLYQNERTRRNEDLTEVQVENLRSQVWDQFVQRILFGEEMEKLGIAVTDSEIVYQIKNYPLDEIRNNETFQTNGQFDWNKYYASFSNPQMPWVQIEEFYRQQLPFQKLQNIITSTIRVSESEIEDEYKASNLRARVDYLKILFSDFNEPTIEVTDDDARSYYDQHIDDYFRKEARELSYVMFDLVPSARDTARIMSEFEDIRQEYANGEDFNNLAEIYSEDPAVKSNRGQYDFFERGAMVKPFEDAAFSGKVGQIVGPIETQFGLHLIRIEDRRVKDGQEQVKVSHILLKIAPGPSTREAIESAALIFTDEAKEEGFDKTAASYDLEVKQTGFLTEGSDFVPGFGSERQIFRFAFANQVDAVSDLVYTEKGYSIFKLSAIRAEGPQPLEEIRPTIEAAVRLEKQKERAREFAQEITKYVADGNPFEQIVNRLSDPKLSQDSTSLFSLNSSIAGMGYDPVFNATAFTLEPGQTSEWIETNRGIFWQKLTERTEFDQTSFESQRELIRNRILGRKRSQAFNDWYEYLKSQADIEDNRKTFNL